MAATKRQEAERAARAAGKPMRRKFDLTPGTLRVERTRAKQSAFDAMSVGERKQRFLAAYEANYGLSARTCQQIGLRHAQLLEWREQDEEFRLKMDELAVQADDSLRNHIMTRAMGLDGERPSDLLAIFEAKRRMPEYRDKEQAVSVHLHDNRTQNMVVVTLDDLRQGLGYLEDKAKELPSPQDGQGVFEPDESDV